MHAMKHLKVSLMLSSTYGQIARYNWPPFMCLINVFVLGVLVAKKMITQSGLCCYNCLLCR